MSHEESFKKRDSYIINSFNEIVVNRINDFEVSLISLSNFDPKNEIFEFFESYCISKCDLFSVTMIHRKRHISKK